MVLLRLITMELVPRLRCLISFLLNPFQRRAFILIATMLFLLARMCGDLAYFLVSRLLRQLQSLLILTVSPMLSSGLSTLPSVVLVISDHHSSNPSPSPTDSGCSPCRNPSNLIFLGGSPSPYLVHISLLTSRTCDGSAGVPTRTTLSSLLMS